MKPSEYIKQLGPTISEAIKSLDVLLIVYDKDYYPVYANDLARDVLPNFFEAIDSGATLDEATQKVFRIFYPDLPQKDIDKLTQELRLLQKSGQTYQFAGVNGKLYAFAHKVINSETVVGFGIDVTDSNLYEERVMTLAKENAKLANTDHLTSLSNRRFFLANLEDRFRLAKINNEELYLALIDLNGFKSINDTYGHNAGDALLQMVGNRLERFKNDATSVARLGGDEFAILSWNQDKSSSLRAFGREICEAISQTYIIENRSINITASLGWARFPTDATTIKCLLRKSDFALYHSKTKKESKPVLFNETHEEMFQRQRTIISELEKDGIEDELHIHFQPIHDIKTQKIRGFEALARWTSPILGPVSPTEFISHAEKSKRITDITPILFRKALKTAEAWPKSYQLHFNLSAIDIVSETEVSRLVDIIKASNFDPKNLIFEVTETNIINSFDSVKHVQKTLSDIGIKLYLDDFGSGYSNLNYINQINAAGIKIDKDFFPQGGLTSETIAILESIQFLCKKLGLDLVVEGIEQQEQLQQLAEMDISIIQGYFFSKPMPPKDLPAYILNHTVDTHLRESESTQISKQLNVSSAIKA